MLDPAAVGVGNAEYGRALIAEGLPAIPGYLTRPMHLVPALTDKRTFGASGFPIKDRRYARGDCPAAERMVDATLLVLTCNERFDATDVADLIEGVRKVHHHYVP